MRTLQMQKERLDRLRQRREQENLQRKTKDPEEKKSMIRVSGDPKEQTGDEDEDDEEAEQENKSQDSVDGMFEMMIVAHGKNPSLWPAHARAMIEREAALHDNIKKLSNLTIPQKIVHSIAKMKPVVYNFRKNDL